MKLLFVHDHPFYEEDGIVYGDGYFPSFTWDNYLINFDEIYIYSRRKTVSTLKKTISSKEHVKFNLTDNYSSVTSLFLNIAKINKELDLLFSEVDVVLTRLPSILGFITAKRALKLGKPLWVEQVGNAKEALATEGSLKGIISARYFDNLNKKLTKKASFVTYVTESKLQSDYPHNINAVTTNLSNVIINNVLEYKELDFCRFYDDLFYIATIGCFDINYKGQDLLLKAIAQLHPDLKNKIKLSFIGTGNYDWLLGLASKLDLKDSIEFVGALEPGNQINEALKRQSLYIQPSLTEGMPRAMIEAMAMGCPVIGSNAGGIPDIVNKKFIHKKGNIEQISEQIDFLYKNREILYSESKLSLEKAKPFLKNNLDNRRIDFYRKMNSILINLNEK